MICHEERAWVDGSMRNVREAVRVRLLIAASVCTLRRAFDHVDETLTYVSARSVASAAFANVCSDAWCCLLVVFLGAERNTGCISLEFTIWNLALGHGVAPACVLR